MSKRVKVLTWTLVFMMLFTCACTAARARKTGERNKGGVHKPEYATSETASTPPTINYSDLTTPTYSYKTFPLEEIIELSKSGIGMNIEDATDHICSGLHLEQYTYNDEYDYALPYPLERQFNGFDEPVFIEGIAFERVTVWADTNNIVQDIEFDIKEHEPAYSPDEYLNTPVFETYLDAYNSNQLLDSKMQLLYGEPDGVYDTSWLYADKSGWCTWVDGSIEYFTFWGQNIANLDGNNSFTFGIHVIDGDSSGSNIISDTYEAFIFEMLDVMGLTDSEAEARIEAFFGAELEPSDITDDNSFNRTVITYKMPIFVEDVAFDGFLIHIDRDTKQVLYIRFFTDSIPDNTAKKYYDIFEVNSGSFRDRITEETISADDSDWTVYQRQYTMDDKHSLAITRKTYKPDESQSGFQIEFFDMDQTH